MLTAHEAGMHGGAGAWARERYGFSRVSEWSVCTSLTSITALSPQHSCRPTQEHMARLATSREGDMAEHRLFCSVQLWLAVKLTLSRRTRKPHRLI